MVHLTLALHRKGGIRALADNKYPRCPRSLDTAEQLTTRISVDVESPAEVAIFGQCSESMCVS